MSGIRLLDCIHAQRPYGINGEGVDGLHNHLLYRENARQIRPLRTRDVSPEPGYLHEITTVQHYDIRFSGLRVVYSKPS